VVNKLIWAFTVLCFFVSLSAKAQDSAHTHFGIFGSYQYGSPVAMNRDAGVINVFDTRGIGISWDNRFGVGAELQTPQLFSPALGLSIHAQYIEGTGEFKSSSGTTNFQIFSKHSEIALEPSLTYIITSKLFLGLGFGVNYRVNNDITQHIQTSVGQDTIIASGESISTSKFHYDIPAFIGARFPLSDLFSLNTEAIARIDIGEMLRGYAKQALSIELRFGISITTDPPHNNRVPEPQNIMPAPSPQAQLSASVHFTTNEKSIRQITAQNIDTTFRQYLMLPSVLYYANNEKGLPLAGDMHTLSLEEIGKRSANETYKNILPIIGSRMNDFPESKLTLSSAPLPQESEDITDQRIQQITSYLKNTWKIPETRIKIKYLRSNTSLPFIEFTDDSKILSPLITEHKERGLAVAPLGLSRFISSEAGVRSWFVKVTDGSHTVAEFSSEDSLAGRSPITTLSSDEHGLSKRIIATFHVTDNNGQSRDAFDTLLVILGSATNAENVTKEVFVLLQDSSQNSLAWINPLREKISQSITPASRILFQPLFSSGKQSIHTTAGQFLSNQTLSIKFSPHIEITGIPFLNSVEVQSLGQLQNAFVITIINP